MANTNQQASADKAPESTPEKTYSAAEYERVDNQRRVLQRENTALKRDKGELQKLYDASLAENEAYEVTLNENLSEESLKEAVKKHVKEVAAHKKDVAALKSEREEFDKLASTTAEENLNKMYERLISEHTIPEEKQSELRDITDPDKAELFAYRNGTKKDAPVKEPEKTTEVKKPDMPLTPSGKVGGDDWHSLPADDKIARGLAKILPK
jgi:hypothetical protein